MLLMLYCLPLMFKVWQKNGSCCCYIVYHYCFRLERREVHVGVVILTIIAVEGLTEEWFMLLMLYCLPLLFKVWQRSGPCCCYIVYNYCLRFDRGVVHVVVILSTNTVKGLIEGRFMLWLLYCLSLLFTVWQRSGSCCFCYIVYHYCFRFDRGVVVLAILSTNTA
jgi:glucan phosphoethanolaminetransferase (alkaline phosphatase superfamily)